MSHGELYDVNDYSPILAENIYYQYKPILSTYYIFYPEAVTLSRILFPFSSGQILGGLIVRNRCNHRVRYRVLSCRQRKKQGASLFLMKIYRKRRQHNVELRMAYVDDVKQLSLLNIKNKVRQFRHIYSKHGIRKGA